MSANTRILGSLLDALPRGRPLPEDVWQTRHRVILVVLWLQACGIVVYGLFEGFTLLHSLFEAMIVAAAALAASLRFYNRRLRSLAASLGLVTSSAVLTHLSGGYIEMHFHFFIMLAVIAVYQEWVPFVLSIVYVAAHHGAFGVLDPTSVYNHPDAFAHPWKWAAIHALFVSGAAAVYVISWRLQEAARDHAEHVLNSAGEGIVGLDARGNITFINAAAERMTGYSSEKLLGRQVWRILRVSDLDGPTDPIGDPVASALEPAGVVPGELCEARIRGTDGTSFLAEVGATSIWDRGRAAGMVITFRDITERKRAEEELLRLHRELESEHHEIEELNRTLEEKVRRRTKELRLANEELRERNRQLTDARAQAATDALTGLRNHRAFQEEVREEVARAESEGESTGLVMLDIDGFKRVNDSHGHLSGDQLLRELAGVLGQMVPRERAYRYGGDEFAVVIPGATPEGAVQTAERVRRAVEEHEGVNGARITVSLGVASFPDTANAAEELIYGADAAMYWAKSSGKNRVGDWGKLTQDKAQGTLPWYAADQGVKAPDAVTALVAALQAKDPQTSAHTERCSHYAILLAEALGIGAEERSVVRLASLLHDVGKIAVPDEVLFKPGPLDEQEWAQMKQHPVAAMHVLSQIHAISEATPAILHHHEHFDGSGYPDGLAGEDIPLAARILLVTDAFDAMTSDRPYRKAMTVEAAVEELKRNSGSQFDPRIVDAFLGILSRQEREPGHEGTSGRAEPAGGRAVSRQR